MASLLQQVRPVDASSSFLIRRPILDPCRAGGLCQPGVKMFTVDRKGPLSSYLLPWLETGLGCSIDMKYTFMYLEFYPRVGYLLKYLLKGR